MEIAIPESKTELMLDSPDFMMPRMPFVVGEVVAGMGAEQAGMAVGDSLTALDGVPMFLFDEWSKALTEMAGSTVEVTVVRDSADVKVPVILQAAVSAEGKLGLKPFALDRYFQVKITEYNFAQAVPAGFRKTGAEISGYWDQLKLIFTPKTGAYKSLGSFISIGNIFPGQWDWYSFWRVTGFLSIILAVMNILPIPALDGGHVMFTLWEVVTRRKPSDKFMERAQVVGMILLFALLIFAFGNDIYRFFIK
jgi:regulator of sigma E protease